MWPNLGDEIKGSSVYGKGCKWVGYVIAIRHLEEEGLYTGNDVVSIEWDNGITARFHRKDLNK